MVSSLTISNSRVPPGVTTFTESPGSLFRNERPIGDVVEILPFAEIDKTERRFYAIDGSYKRLPG